jgi:hypothetical protein
MNRWLMLSGGVVATALLTTGLAFGQQTQPQPAKSADCKAPPRVEGQVVSVDKNRGMMTIRDSQGQTHEFQASQETLSDMKKGDKIEAQLRQAPNC